MTPPGAAPEAMGTELDEFRRAARTALAAPRPREMDDLAARDELPAWEKGAREALCSLGAFGLLIDEARGGSAAGFGPMIVALEEAGRAGVGRWFSTSAVVAARLLAPEADTAVGKRLLPDLAAGSRLATVAVTGPSGRYDLSAVAVTATAAGRAGGGAGQGPGEGGAVLAGVADFVPALGYADCVVVAARLDGGVGAAGRPSADGLPSADRGVGLFVVDRTDGGVTFDPVDPSGSTGLNGLGSLRLEGVQVPVDRVLSGRLDEGRLADLVAAGAVAVSAEMVGSADRVLDLTVGYAEARQQFGSPIGAFGTVQHHCVQMRTDVQVSRAVTVRAAAAFDAGDPDAIRLASVAKAWTARATRRVIGRGHRVHGAIGFSAEHELGRHSVGQRESWALWGDPRFHAGRIASGLDGRIASGLDGRIGSTPVPTDGSTDR